MEIIFLDFENRGQEWIFYPRVVKNVRGEYDSQEERIQSAFHFPVFHRLAANCSKFFILASPETSFTHYFYLLSSMSFERIAKTMTRTFQENRLLGKLNSVKRFLIVSNQNLHFSSIEYDSRLTQDQRKERIYSCNKYKFIMKLPSMILYSSKFYFPYWSKLH